MSTDQPVPAATPARTSGLIERAKNILLHPQAEWQKIAGETTSLGALLTGYALPLAAVAVIAASLLPVLIGGLLSFGIGLVFGVIGMALAVAAMLLVVVLIGLLVNALAPAFGSEKNAMRAYQLVIYAYTPVWIGVFCFIIPPLGMLGAALGGVYAWILVYLGLPGLMKTPEDKRILYVLSVFAITMVAGWIIAMIAATTMFGLVGAGMMGFFGAAKHMSY